MNRKSRFAPVVVACVAALLATSTMFAASQNAVLYGTVYDTAGGPVAGITVNLQNASVGFDRTTITGSDGEYNFAEVPPAENYKLSCEFSGRKLDIRTGITVNVGDERVILPPLKEQIAVFTPNPEIKSESSTQSEHTETVSTAISGVITGEQLRALPVFLNRNFLNAGALTPNTHDVEQGSRLSGASFSVAGNRAATNNFLLDGVDNVASSSNQAVPFQVNDAVQEFRVTSSAANAEYGRNSGGTVNIVTRRGGNGWHGSAFGFFNIDALNANSPLSVYNGSTFDQAAGFAGDAPTEVERTRRRKPTASSFPLNYNQYAVTALANGQCTDSISAQPATGLLPCATGGFGQNQLFDPGQTLGTDSKRVPFESKQFGLNQGGAFIRNKWFVFGSYEGTIIDNPNPIFERVPTSFDKTYNPLLAAGIPDSAPFKFASNDPNYVMDQKILSLYPASNVVGIPDALEFYRGEAPNFTNVHNLLLRSDWTLSHKTTISARYVGQFLKQLHDDTLPLGNLYRGNGAYRDALNQNLDLTLTHNTSSALITELRAGSNRFYVKETAQDQALDARTLGLPNAALPTFFLTGIDPQTSGQTPFSGGGFLQAFRHSGAATNWEDAFGLFPTLDGLFPLTRLGAPTNTPNNRRDTTEFLGSTTSYSVGKHAFKFGAELRHIDNRLTDAGLTRGFVYSGNIGEFTSDSESCNGGCANNAFRAPSFNFAQFDAPFTGRFGSYDVSGFLQDTWRLHPRLTLNLGVRYEFFQTPKEQNDLAYNYDPIANGLVQENHTAVLDPYGNACGTAPASFASIPQSNSSTALIQSALGGIGSVLPRGWNCSPTSTFEFNKLARNDRDNFAPRLGLAWDLFGDGHTVARFGAGIFNDQLPASFISKLIENRPQSLSNPNTLFGSILRAKGFCGTNFGCGVGSSILNPAVQAAISPDGVNANSFYTAASQPAAIYARDTLHSETPYSTQMSATIQQQITGKMVIEIGYIGSLGRRLPVIYNSNFGKEWDLTQRFVDNFAFTPIFTLTNRGSSNYHSLLVSTHIADLHGLHLNATYNWSKSIDNASSSLFPNVPVTGPNLLLADQFFTNGNTVLNCFYRTAGNGGCLPNVVPVTPNINFNAGALTTSGAGQILTSPYLIPQDPFNFLKDERGLSDFNSKHKVVVDYIYDVPSVHVRGFGNWQLSGVVTAQTGQPFSIFAGPVLNEFTQRVNVAGPVQLSRDPNNAIDPSNIELATADPACALGTAAGVRLLTSSNTACIGDSRRNQFTGFDYVNMNVAIQKGFQVLGEGHRLIFRAEFYNVLNHSNFYNPISAFSLDGTTLNPNFGRIESAHDPRQIQFSLRLVW